MTERVIVAGILLLAAAFVARRAWRVLKGQSFCCRGDCSACMPEGWTDETSGRQASAPQPEDGDKET